ncbi:MAG: hypothetical protein LBU73_00215 [Helicobacteraceae bacterium]|jgi:DNA polymerase-3 subunit delta'|nr:hypothetical protein [Helicobacteraceae bacterium]
MGKLIVSSDLDFALRNVVKTIGDSPHRIYIAQKDNFNIEEARLVIAEAYIASDREKFLICLANGYNIAAQNALLKLLEEPPLNITIYLIAPSKAAFLPTVRSRLPLEVIKAPKRDFERLIDFDNLSLESIYEFLKTQKFLSKDRAKNLIEEAFISFQKRKVESHLLRKRFLDAISRGFMLLSTNSNSQNAILPILLLFMEIDSRNARTKTAK